MGEVGREKIRREEKERIHDIGATRTYSPVRQGREVIGILGEFILRTIPFNHIDNSGGLGKRNGKAGGTSHALDR